MLRRPCVVEALGLGPSMLVGCQLRGDERCRFRWRAVPGRDSTLGGVQVHAAAGLDEFGRGLLGGATGKVAMLLARPRGVADSRCHRCAAGLPRGGTVRRRWGCVPLVRIGQSGMARARRSELWVI